MAAPASLLNPSFHLYRTTHTSTGRNVAAAPMDRQRQAGHIHTTPRFDVLSLRQGLPASRPIARGPAARATAQSFGDPRAAASNRVVEYGVRRIIFRKPNQLLAPHTMPRPPRDPSRVTPPWKRKRPKGRGKPLTTVQIDAARRRATEAGRRYPNLVDNMWAARHVAPDNEVPAEDAD